MNKNWFLFLKTKVLSYACTHHCHQACLKWRVYIYIYIYIYIYYWGHPFLRMYLWQSLCTLYLLTCQVRVTVDDTKIIIMIIKRISRVPIYCTMWEHRVLYNITNNTHTHTHTLSLSLSLCLSLSHAHTHTHLHTHVRKT